MPYLGVVGYRKQNVTVVGYNTSYCRRLFDVQLKIQLLSAKVFPILVLEHPQKVIRIQETVKGHSSSG